MLTLLSPAKKLLTFNQPYLELTSSIIFSQKTAALIALLQKLDKPSIGRLMKISNDLATINHERFQKFDKDSSQPRIAYPAIFLFRGDVYKSLEVDQWDKASLDFAQSHLMILSGLYGLLRPLDLIQPYRLEMGTKLVNADGKDLYAFWKKAITTALNDQIASHANAIILNLASSEYFSVVDQKSLKAPCVNIHFKEQKGDEQKVIGIHAKKARGAMAKYINQHKIDDIDSVKKFNGLGYQYVNQQSDMNNLIFVREI